MKTKITILLLLLCGLFATSVTAQRRYYVVQGASGAAASATSWGAATGNLQLAIDEAYRWTRNNSWQAVEVWVANGTYTPNGNETNLRNQNDAYSNNTSYLTTAPIDRAFQMRPNVKIYGGLTSGATSLSGRSFQTVSITSSNATASGNGSILSGGNARYHVIIAVADNMRNAVLDGFSITGGRANTGAIAGGPMMEAVTMPEAPGAILGKDFGAGLYVIGRINAAASMSPTFDNLRIYNNEATSGGGVHMTRSKSNMSNSIIFNNKVLNSANAGVVGAGVYLNGVGSRHTFQNVRVVHNECTRDGGGIAVTGHATTDNIELTLNNCTIQYNDAQTGGGIFSDSRIVEAAKVYVTNNTLVANNTAYSGGGIYISGDTQTSALYVTNSKVTNNTASNSAGGIHVGGATLANISRSQINNNTGTNGCGGVMVAGTSIVNIRDFSQINGNTAPNGSGGGIYTSNNSTLNISEHCTIDGNTSSGMGGGLYLLSNGTNSIINSYIRGNISTATVYIYTFTNSNSTFANVLVGGNNGGSSGGFNISANPTVNLTNVTVAGNSGSGLSGTPSRTTLYNTLIWRNANNTPAATGAALKAYNSLIQGVNNTADGNLSGTCDYPQMFVDDIQPSSAPTTGGNYYPRSIATEPVSVAVDRGNNSYWNSGSWLGKDLGTLSGTTVTDRNRIIGTIDMGAFETECINKVDASMFKVPDIVRICPNTSANLTAELEAGTTLSNPVFRWYATPDSDAANKGACPLSITNGSPSTYNTGDLTTGTYTYYVSLSADGYCESLRKPVTVTVSATPVIGITAVGTQCPGATVTLSVTDATTQGTVTWSETSGGTSIGTGRSISVTLPTGTSKIYYARVATTCGTPSTSVTVALSSPTAPTLSASSVTTICSGSAATLIATSSVSGASYKWYATLTSTGVLHTGATYTPSPASSTTYYVTVTNASLCESPRLAVPVTVESAPTVTINTTGGGAHCMGTKLTLSATVTPPNATINWYDASGGTGTHLGSGLSVDIYPEAVTAEMLKYYYARVTTNCGTNEDFVSFTIKPLPIVATNDTTVCIQDAGTTVNLTARVTNAGVAGMTNYTIRWYNDATGGSPIAGGGSYTIPSTAGTKIFYVDAISQYSCVPVTRTPLTVTIKDCTQPCTTPNITLVTAPDTTVCTLHDKMYLRATTTTSGAVIHWYDASDDTELAGSPAATIELAIPNTASTKTYYAKAIVSTCESAKMNVIVRARTPDIIPSTISNAAANICDGEVIDETFLLGMINVIAPKTLADYTITIFTNAGRTLPFTTPITTNHSSLPTHTFYLTSVAKTTGCETTSPSNFTLTVSVKSFNATISGTLEVCDNGSGSTTLTANHTGATAPIEYQWYYGILPDPTTVATGASTGATYMATAGGFYKVKVTDADNCESEASVEIEEVACGSIEAIDDYYTVIKNSEDNELDVKINDDYSCLSPIVRFVLPPSHGMAIIVGDKFVYTPDPDYTGLDSFRYSIQCDGYRDTATVYINIVFVPDNVVDIDCVMDAPNITRNWTIAGTKTAATNLSTYQNALAGDIDGDGIMEIIVGGDVQISGTLVTKIYIYKGNNLSLAPKSFSVVSPFLWSNVTKYSIGKTTIAGKDSTLIVVAEGDRRLRAYNYNGGLIWTSNADFHATSNNYAPVFADMNNDGIPEIVINGRIFNSTNGHLLCSSGANGHTIAADLFHSGKLNLVVGNQIFEPNAALTSLTHLRTLALTVHSSDPNYPGSITVPSGGHPAVADMDNDGKLDVIIRQSTGESGYYSIVSVFNPATGALKATKYIPNAGASSYPFIGDIDGDGLPEIVLIKNRYANFGRTDGSSETAGDAQYCQMLAYKYVPGNVILQQFWSYQHYDYSGSTGMTLFDFNQDGIYEIVYRDEWNLRIINGSGKHHTTGLATGPYNLSNIQNNSGTSYEYPIVADVDGDGQAEIIIVGAEHNNNLESNNRYEYSGALWIYKSANPALHPWAPTRKVWNQYEYNSVNVNEDLTIPRYQFNPATVFPGADGVLGTADDVRPFNNFYQQQTTIDMNGLPVWLAPDAVAKATLSTHSVTGTALTVNFGFTNEGDASIGAPIHITLYDGSISSANKITTSTFNIKLLPGDTSHVVMNVADVSTLNSQTIIVRVNDDGITFPYQMECDTTNNVWQFNLSVYRWWYLSSPYSNATTNTFDIPAGTVGTKTGSMVSYYSEVTKSYSNNPLGANQPFNKPGMGIVASLDTTIAVFNPPTIGLFDGLTPHLAVFTATVTNTDTDATPGQSGKEGKNLLGNPYSNPMDFDAFFDANLTRIGSTYWMRGWNRTTGIMTYDQYNRYVGSGTGNINGTNLNNVIPVIQGFWVQARTSGSVTFTQSDIEITTPISPPPVLRSPAANASRIARLTVTGERASDQTLIALNPGASNTYDMYDSEKMTSHSSIESDVENVIPEIYTRIGNDELAINGMSPNADEISVALGFRTKRSGSFTISGVFENWDNAKVFLRDNNNGYETELTANNSYSFTSGLYDSTNRFTVVIRRSADGLDVAEYNTKVFVNENNKIAVVTDLVNAECTVYNALGQKLNSETITFTPQVLSCVLESGVYIVKVGNKTERVIIK